MNAAHYIRKSFIIAASVGAVFFGIMLLERIGTVAIRLTLPLLLIGGLGWLILSVSAPSGARVARRLSKRQFERAFQAAMAKDEGHVISEHLHESLALPAESLRPRIVAAFNELHMLHTSAYDPANTYVSPGLKKAMQESSDEARNAFWRVCRNLAVVADQKVKFDDDHHKIRHLGESIERLKTSAAEVRAKFAELSLGATEAEVEEAAQAIENVKKQSEALIELESMFD
jgi:hypothetical protein